MSETKKNSPWWREPWPWILMAGPAAAIVGCVITIGLAIQNFSDQPITDGGSKRGLIIERNAASAGAPVAEDAS